MPAPEKYPDELRERAVRLYRESEPRPTFRRLGEQPNVHLEALRDRVRPGRGRRRRATRSTDDRPLTDLEWERVRLHSYYTDRMLRRPPLLAELGAVAALAHERLDGSGYHRGLPGTAVPACRLRS